MLQYIQWFLTDFDTVLTPAELSDVYSCLAICIPVVFTLAAVFGICWAIVGVFGGGRR